MAFFMDDVVNLIKMHSGKQDQSYGFLRNVKIKEYNPETNRVIVAFFNSVDNDWTMISNWMPWFVPFNGQGEDVDAATGELWGMVYGPCINEHAFMLPLAGNPNVGIVIGGIFTDPRPPPSIDGRNCQAGEWMYKHKSTSYMYWDNAGNLNVYTDNDTNLVVHGNCNITVMNNANITVGGNTVVNVDGDLSATVGGNTSLNVDGNVSAVVGGNLSVDVDGDMIAVAGGTVSVNADGDLVLSVGGSLNANVGGAINLAAMDNITFSTNGSFTVAAAGNMNLQSTGPIGIVSTTEVATIAPLSPNSTTHTVLIPPVLPFVFGTPANPNQPSQPVQAEIPNLPADGRTVNVAPTDNAMPDAPTNPQATTVTSTSATIAFQDPNVST